MSGLQVGDGVTVAGYSDSDPYTVVSVKGRRATIRADKATLLNGVRSGEPDALQFDAGGFCGHTSGRQRWDIQPDPNGATRDMTLRRDGQWRLVGHGLRDRPVTLGRHKHHDFNF